MNDRYDTIIIGAGPAGASAAILLAQAGWTVALVERQRFPRRKVCGECIAATNFEMIDALGIGADFHRLASAPLRRMMLMTGPHTIHADLPELRQGRHPWGKALSREHLDTLLVERAITVGATVLQPWQVRTLSGQPGNYACRVSVADGDTDHAITLHAPIVIAAHGSWERVPASPESRSAPNAARLPSDLFAFKANFREAVSTTGAISVLAFDGGYGGMVLENGGVTTVACCVRRDSLAQVRRSGQHRSAAAAVEALLKTACHGVDVLLADASREDAWLSSGPIRPGIRMHRGNRVFLIGNAAGEAHPIVGEGISMALQSAWLLCERLIAHRAALRPGLQDGSAYPALQQEYADRWRHWFAPRIRMAAVFAHAAMRPRLLPGLLPLIRRWPGMLTHGARLSGKVLQSAVPQQFVP